jgi:2-oxoisovalerate dehydrogenase E1 component alpha subunit
MLLIRRVAQEQRPALIELMTYRTAHHSTSDDSTKYRPLEEIRQENAHNNPLDRMRNFLDSRGWWDNALEAKARDKHRTAARASLVQAESKPRPPVSTLFDDVYDTSTQHLDKQKINLDHFILSQQQQQLHQPP